MSNFVPAWTSNMMILSFSILVPQGRYLSGTGNHTIAVVKGCEDYETISKAFGIGSPFLLRLWFVACLRVMLTTNLMYPDPPYVAYMPGVQESLAAKFFGVPRRDTNCNRMDTTD
eukprot:Em0001g3235a